MHSPTTVRVFETADEVAHAAAEQFVERAQNSSRISGRFAVALAGGTTPRRMYELLAGNQFRNAIDWTTVQLFFGDERFVPSDHPESNYRLASDALISQVEIPSVNIHRIEIQADATSSATRYESELHHFFKDVDVPRFDLVLLGLGEDGHTASLFPNTNALNVTDKWVVANFVEKLESYRITLTARAINAAANVMFLVAGANKAPAVSAVLNGPFQPESLPAQLIKPEAGTLTWLLDAPAASLLAQH